jgi:hypothetical protein
MSEQDQTGGDHQPAEASAGQEQMQPPTTPSAHYEPGSYALNLSARIERLGEQLYDAFWARQPSPDAPAFSGQATAIRKMWFGIAGDALSAIKEP